MIFDIPQQVLVQSKLQSGYLRMNSRSYMMVLIKPAGCVTVWPVFTTSPPGPEPTNHSGKYGKKFVILLHLPAFTPRDNNRYRCDNLGCTCKIHKICSELENRASLGSVGNEIGVCTRKQSLKTQLFRQLCFPSERLRQLYAIDKYSILNFPHTSQLC